MANRRMFSKSIVENDVFLDMPLTTQALYLHLNMNADDDGFVSPKRIMRMIGAGDDDLKLLVAKRYILMFPSGVVVIKHWQVNNNVRKDRYTKTTFQEELSMLTTNNFGAYTEITKIPAIVEKITSTQGQLPMVVNQMATNGMTNGIPRLGKVRLGKVSIKPSQLAVDDVEEVFEKYVKAFDSPNTKLSPLRKTKIRQRLEDAGKEMLLKAIENTSKSPHHIGDNDRGWKANLDFIIRSYEQVERLSELDLSAPSKERVKPSLDEIRSLL